MVLIDSSVNWTQADIFHLVPELLLGNLHKCKALLCSKAGNPGGDIFVANRRSAPIWLPKQELGDAMKCTPMNIDRGDFRNKRYKLPPEAFALRPDGPVPPPRDVVNEVVWREIVTLPDDVSIRTSDDFGTEMKAMTQLWGSVIDMCNKTDDALFHAILDVADALQACMFNALCGYYRVAASCLRAGVESTVIGTYLQMEKDKAEALRWQRGEVELKFGASCDSLSADTRVRMLENYLKKEMQYSVFHRRMPGADGGWARHLFSELSNFAHGRPTHSEGALWEGSNGPVFIPGSFGRIYSHYLDVCALFYVLAKLGRPEMALPPPSNWLFKSRNVHPSQISVYCFEYLWGKDDSPDKKEGT